MIRPWFSTTMSSVWPRTANVFSCVDAVRSTIPTEFYKQTNNSSSVTQNVHRHQYTKETHTHTHTTVLRPFFQVHPGEPVPEENFWTSWCKWKLTEADTPTIQLGATPSGLTSSAHLHHPPFLYGPDALPAAQPTASKHWRQLAHADWGEDARVLLNGVTCTISVGMDRPIHYE